MPVRRIQRGQRDAGDRRRQRERQIDQGIDDAASRELVADQHPGDEKAEDRVHHGRDERRAELRRYDATTRGSLIVCQNASQVSDAVRAGSVSERDKDDEAQVEHRVPHRQPESRQHSSPFRAIEHQ